MAMTANVNDINVEQIDTRTRTRALIGSAIGSTVEWYDYFLYGTMASIVFGHLFFPSADKTTETLLSLASFALAFLVRPIGGIVFSHIGDRIGRKKTLVVTLSLMGASTAGMGLLPDHAAIGVWAGVLLTLLRLIQGLALGGEWGGGLLLAVEYAPRKKRGLYGAVPQVGALIGLALGNFTVAVMNALLTETQFLSWGWRIPFVLSIFLVLFGLWIRKAVDETPSFKKVKAEGHTANVPLLETLRNHGGAVAVTIGAKFIETSSFFLFATFTISYAVSLGYTRAEALNAVLAAALVAVPMMLAWGALSDRIGRKLVFGIGTVAIMIYIIPFLWIVNQKDPMLLMVACIVGFGVIWASYGSVLGTMFAESYPADVRYTGVSLGYQIGAAIVGGPAPLIATALLAAYHSYIPVGLFVVVCGAISLFAISRAEDRTGADLD
jgi:MFS family permease